MISLAKAVERFLLEHVERLGYGRKPVRDHGVTPAEVRWLLTLQSGAVRLKAYVNDIESEIQNLKSETPR